MIGSIGKPKTRLLRHAHRRRNRLAWIMMACLVVAAAVFLAAGHFRGIEWTTLLDAVARTTYRLIAAYLIALVLGVGVALVVGWSPLADFFFPLFDILQNVPSFALFPIFLYLFGLTDTMIIFFAVSSIVWPILFAVLTAIKNAHRDLNDAASIFGATGVKRITAYLAPLSFPSILTGSIVGIAIGWESVIGAEIIAASGGFGAFIRTVDTTGLNPGAVAGALAILIIVFVINRIVWAPLLAESSRRYAE